ncbi:MAG: efflux RND transporter periplasmic adaptor subunit [Pseudomonadota bacterium]
MKYDKKQVIAVGVILLAGALLAALLLASGKPQAAAEDEKPAAHAATQKGAGPAPIPAPGPGPAPTSGASAGSETGPGPEMVAFTEAQLNAAGITLAAAGPAQIAAGITLPGEIRFNGDRTAHVVPRVAGVVERVLVDLGQQVKKGQVLAVIASSELSERRSELLSARQRLSLAQTLLAREKQLWEEKISAEQDYLQARQAANEAGIAARNAQQKLDALGAGALPPSAALNSYQIRAPFDGMVLEKHLSAGEAVKEDASIFTISDLSTVWAEVAVAPADLDALRVGQQADIKAAAFDATTSGKVIYVGALLGEQSRTATARIDVRNPDRAWRPGLFVNVTLSARPAPVKLAVLADAVQTVDDKPSVFVRSADGFIVRHVKLGRGDGKLVEVLDGLEAGARYAAANSFAVKAELGKSGNEHAH